MLDENLNLSEPDEKAIAEWVGRSWYKGSETYQAPNFTTEPEYTDYNVNDRYTWVNDTELENLKDYQARRQPVCKSCGKVKPLPGQEVNGAAYSGGACPWCGGKDWESKTQDFEELYAPVQRSDGTFIGGMQ